MARFVDFDEDTTDDTNQDDLVIDSLLDDTKDTEDTRPPTKKPVSSRRRIEEYMELRRMRDDLDDPFFDYD